jgi:cyclohexyl-isocyanide hydratase
MSNLVMMNKGLLQVGMLCYPRITQLDLTGPFEVLARMPDTKVHILWKDTSPVKDERGFVIVPDLTLRDAPRLDVIVVPGGPGQQDLMEDGEVRDFLRIQGRTAQYIVSVCTGSLVLAASGLLDGYRATCHWLFLPLLQLLGAIPTRERVVIDRNRVTAAGVSAGIDCAFHLVALLRGQETAQSIQLQLEYDPQPPFDCGSMSKAPEWLVQRITERAQPLIEARRLVAERISKAHASGAIQG